MNEKELLRTGEMLLPAIAYGDAAGVPVETKSFRYITGNYGRINQLISAKDNFYSRSLSDRERYQQYDQLTTMTHDSDVARISTRVHGDVLYGLMMEEFDPKRFGHKLRQLAVFHESQFESNTTIVSECLEPIGYDHILSVPEIQGLYTDRAATMTDKEFGKSYGFYVPETLAISYAAFRLGRGDFNETVYTAVNLGGDADSTASISGAMVNFRRKGEFEAPSDFDQIQDSDNLRSLSSQLAVRALAA